MAAAKPDTAPAYPDGPSHAEDHLIRVRQVAWDKLSELAAFHDRSRKSQFSVIIDDYYKRHPPQQ